VPGPLPTPSAIVATRGEAKHRSRADKERRSKEPAPQTGMPVMPSFLDAAAKRIWRRLGPQLVKIGTLTVVDGESFGLYCQARADYARHTRSLRESGETTLTDSGYIQQRPEVSMRNRAAELMLKIAPEFGIGAASRTRIHVESGEATENPLAAVMSMTDRRRKS